MIRFAALALAGLFASPLPSPTLAPVSSSKPVASPITDLAPPELECLARFYSVTAVPDTAGKWVAKLPGGKSIPFDDGRSKTFDEKLADPDVEDTFSIPYRTGSITAISEKDDDPGRIRIDAVFQATYGESEKEVASHLVPLDFLGTTLRVNAKVKDAFERVAKRLVAARAKNPALAPFLERVGGTFNWRVIAGTTRPSAHSYGVSIDLNVSRSDYWQWQKGPLHWTNRIPPAIVDAFEAEGFVWGGRWYHFDTMHFEYRPELLDPSCRSVSK